MSMNKIINSIIVLLVISITAACKGDVTLSNITEPAASDNANDSDDSDDSDENICSKKIIDSGNKGVLATNPRGTFSDIAKVPNSDNYATVYIDPATSTIKSSFWNGSNFSHEIIAGDHLASYIKIVFLSNGRPLIFWTDNSTTVKMASRSENFGTTGTWTISVLDSIAGMASRAINVSVNPLDEVAIAYLTNSTTATAARFIVCQTSCTSASNFTAMSSASMNIESNTTPSAAITSQVAIGVSWCKGSSDEYYPAVLYGANNTVSQTRYAVCTQANLQDCLINTNWNKTTVSATNNTSSSLYIDSNIVNDTAKVATVTAGIRTYESSGGCSAPGSWNASTGVLSGTTTTDGNAWIHLTKSRGASTADDRYHIVANATTTSFRYYNTSNNAFNTLASWNPVGVIQTTTLLATATTAGGITLLNNSNELLTTHYTSVAPQNLVISKIRNYNQSANTTAIDLFYPNTSGNLQLIGATANSTTASRSISIDSTRDGRPAVAYIDFSAGTHLTGKLKYAFRNSLQNTSSWSIITVPTIGSGPMYPSLKFDHLKKPWISYYDFNSTAANSRFYLMTNSETDGTGNWEIFQFPHSGTAAAIALGATPDTALGMYYNSGISYPVMAVIENNTARVIKASRFNPKLGTFSGSTGTTIDTLSVTGATNLVMDNDSNGNIVLAWTDLMTTSPFAGVEYSYSNGGLTWSTPKRIHSDSTTIQKIGQGTDIKINPETGYPAISYYDRAADRVYISRCEDTPLNCTIGSWNSTTLETSAGVYGATTYIGSGATTTRDQLLSTSIIFSNDGLPSVIFPTGNGSSVAASSSGNLKKVSLDEDDNVTSEILVSGKNASGSITSVNIAVSGHNVKSVKTSTNEQISVYIGAGNYLESYSCQ